MSKNFDISWGVVGFRRNINLISMSPTIVWSTSINIKKSVRSILISVVIPKLYDQNSLVQFEDAIFYLNIQKSLKIESFGIFGFKKFI